MNNDLIKIVYSWIGPKGPIVNTELPNILSFAGVAEGGSTDSNLYWADDIYWRIFLHNGPFALASTAHMENNETFIYPFTLAWRIQFQNYFLSNNGILEFSHTPNHITHQVRHHRGFFLIELAAEAFIQDSHLMVMHSYFTNLNIPMGKIIYVTGCMNAETLYDRWCERSGISPDPIHRMNMVSFPISQHALSMHVSVSPQPNYDETKVPNKLFLVWNRRFRRHRTLLALALDKAGLVDRSYFSMSALDPEMQTVKFKNTIDLYSDPALGLTAEGADAFVNKLPLVIDGETVIAKMCGDFDAAAREFYQDSLVSIVTETNFELAELTLTEKSFKPAKEKHPFIIVGVAGALKAMREFGFKTFGDFWDESYDECEDPKLRLHKIVEVCKDIGSWDSDKILEFRRNVKPIVEHNFQVLKKNTAKIVADKIESIVRSKT